MKQAGQHQVKLRVFEAPCWKCEKPMKICYGLDGQHIVLPSEFDDELKNRAQANGVLLEDRFSKTVEESYIANVCPVCRSFVGDWFLREYWLDEVNDLPTDLK